MSWGSGGIQGRHLGIVFIKHRILFSVGMKLLVLFRDALRNALGECFCHALFDANMQHMLPSLVLHQLVLNGLAATLGNGLDHLKTQRL